MHKSFKTLPDITDAAHQIKHKKKHGKISYEKLLEEAMRREYKMIFWQFQIAENKKIGYKNLNYEKMKEAFSKTTLNFAKTKRNLSMKKKASERSYGRKRNLKFNEQKHYKLLKQ